MQEYKDLGRLGRLKDEKLDYAFALGREAAWRAIGKRPYPVQIMGALAMAEGYVIEMATGEGKTLTAALAAAISSWSGKNVHVITVNDYLVERDAKLNEPIYRQLETTVGYVIHDTKSEDRIDMYRRGVTYVTSKELVADFLRDQIMMGNLRTSSQTAVGMLLGQSIRSRPIVPGLFHTVADEADSLLIDEAVTPLIISSAPNDEVNGVALRARRRAGGNSWRKGRDFKVDRTVKQVDLTKRRPGVPRRTSPPPTTPQHGFWAGKRRREELVVQALTARHCFHLDEHYLITDDGKIVIIDEFTGRVMADRSWRHGSAPGDRTQGEAEGHERQGEPRPHQLPEVLPPVSER